MSMIFQEPMTALNPVMTCGDQIDEVLRQHTPMSAEQRRSKVLEIVREVLLPDPERIIASYPHQLSGGQRQRIMIAMALVLDPVLLIADEPTTALDVTIQAQILFEMQRLCRETGTALIWISHDLSVVAGLADEVAVMYGGRIVEHGSTAAVIERPRHPYTRGLIGSVPSRNPRGARLRQIPGMAPSPLALDEGCAFRARCADAGPACQQRPMATDPEPGHRLWCHHPVLEPLA
jgi:peptide/nickel transport system ATP-binding protein